ncbi:MAG: hypothetical protein CMG08_02770 [Candidatus Marinimicrobia bacterium]|nr:hypothetical protein [Candidatus Neomarinimicrobiota bacterium]
MQLNNYKAFLFITSTVLMFSCSLRPSFRIKKEKTRSASTQVSPKIVTREVKPVRNISSSEVVTINRDRPSLNIEPLPEGWTVDRHPVAKWGMSLPTVLSNVLDSAQTVEYWEDVLDLPTGYKVPIKRSKVMFQIITRLTIETVELHFLNINHIYSATNHEPSHYIMDKVVRAIELKPSGFPQLTADDVIKYKYLMTYGTPREFTDGFHYYDNSKTVLRVRELDKSHVQIFMNSPEVDEQLNIAIEDMYSIEGIEYQKRLLLRSIDP